MEGRSPHGEEAFQVADGKVRQLGNEFPLKLSRVIGQEHFS